MQNRTKTNNNFSKRRDTIIKSKYYCIKINKLGIRGSSAVDPFHFDPMRQFQTPWTHLRCKKRLLCLKKYKTRERCFKIMVYNSFKSQILNLKFRTGVGSVWHQAGTGELQGISEKCIGAFKFGCHIIFWSIYLSKICRKSGVISLSIYQIHTKKYSYYVLIL